MAYKPSHLGRTLRKKTEQDGPIVKLQSRDLNDAEKAQIAASKKAQAERLARIAARSRGEEV